MAKQGDFGGIPQDVFDLIINHWGTAGTGGASAADSIKVLEALAKERHAAARTKVEADVVAVTLKVITIQKTHLAVIGSGGGTPASDLVAAFAKLEDEWK